MKAHLVLVSLVLLGCTTPTRPTDDSVRDRLAAEPVLLSVAAAIDAGRLDAAHETAAGWQSGTAAISIQSGELGLDVFGPELIASSLELDLAPIDVPASVFGAPAQLAGVRLELPVATSAAIAWSDDDHATATLPLALSLSWSLVIGGTTSPLGTQQLPAIPLDVALGGDGASITATLRLHADGELWSWADLLKLSALDVAATATSE
jgi:hypothetical protein